MTTTVSLTCPVCEQVEDGREDRDLYAAEMSAFRALAWHIQAAHGHTPEHAAVQTGEALRAVRRSRVQTGDDQS
jgi:hypothetical protein